MRSAVPLAVALVIGTPFSYEFHGVVDLFYVQLAVFAFFFFFHVIALPSPRPLSSLDRLVLGYLMWVGVTFSVNFGIGLVKGQFADNFSRIISLGQLLVLMAPYVLSRHYLRDSVNLARFARISIIAFAPVIAYFFWRLVQVGLGDLVAARIVLRQRLPVVVCFVATVAFVLAWRGAKYRILYACIAIAGTVLVVISLTRASYIQWLASVGLLFIVAFRRFSFRKKVASALIAVLFVAVAIGVLVLLTGVEQITDRVTVTSSGQDESASSRLTIWKVLAGRVLENPVRAIGGFGQLGASYIGEGFWSDAGFWVNRYSAHSEYMDTLVRSGLIGLVIIMLIFWKIVEAGVTVLSALPESGVYHFAYAIAVFGAAFYGIFQESLRYPIFGMYFWFVAGFFSSALIDVEHPRESSEWAPIQARSQPLVDQA